MQESSVSTTDATVTTLSTIMVYPNTVVHIEGTVVARRTGGSSGTAGDAATYQIKAAFKNVDGVTSALGSADAFASEDQAGWDAAYNVSSPNVLLQVTGASGNNVDWSANTKVTIVK